MKKVFFGLLILTVLSGAGCNAPEFLSVKIDGPRTVGMRLGQRLELRLDSNPTTGYSWAMAETLNKGVLDLSGDPRYVVKSSLMGGGGYELYRVEALKQGNAKLKFEYRRPWETGVAPIKTYFVSVIVT